MQLHKLRTFQHWSEKCYMSVYFELYVLLLEYLLIPALYNQNW